MTIGLDISVLNDKNRTGIGVYVFNLIEHLIKVDNTDRFILFALSPLATYDYMTNLKFNDYQHVRLKIFKMPAKFFRSAFVIWQKINWPPIEMFTEKVDIFHSFNWFLPPQVSGKSVATVFDITSIAQPNWHQQRTTQLDSLRFQRISKYADLVLTISQNSKRDFLNYFSNSRVDVIYPGSSSIFSRKINKEKMGTILRKYNLDPGYILSVGTLEPRKNLTSLIKAYLKVNLSMPLVLVGAKGWKNQEIIDRIKKQSTKIRLVGFIPDEELAILYKGALCLVYPSFYEGFGIPILESMKCGTPVISSNTSSLTEVGGDAVLYIDPYDQRTTEEALVKIVGDSKLRTSLVSKGRKQAQKFSWTKSANKLISLYHSLK